METKNLEKLKQQQLERYHTVDGWIIVAHQSLRKRLNNPKYYKIENCCSFEEFRSFVKNNDRFYEIFNAWKSSGFSKQMAPSVDRIDSSLDYCLDNIQILTYSENKKKGCHEKTKENGSPVVIFSDNSAHVFPSMGIASMEMGFKRGAVNQSIRNGRRIRGMEVFKIEKD